MRFFHEQLANIPCIPTAWVYVCVRHASIDFADAFMFVDFMDLNYSFENAQ